MTLVLPGLSSFSDKFNAVLSHDSWRNVQTMFNSSSNIFLVGNGGNLAVCDHGAIDISRLTPKSASAPGSGILASSLINDKSHDLWVKNWFSISTRNFPKELLSKSMLIGVSSSGYSKNICLALDYCVSLGVSAALISAVPPKIAGSYDQIVLNVNEYHTAEVLTLALIYQLIHASGSICPTIEESNVNSLLTDYGV